MQELLKKIQADASQRLVLPPGRSPHKELARFKAFLKLETHRLKISHRGGAGGLQICQARAAMLDQLLCHLWTGAKNTISDQGQKEFPQLALVALGGYGRGELNPHSDIDFMFLHEGQVAVNQPLPYLARIIDGLLYPLWDLGLKVGYSVRNIDESLKVANADMQSKTSLIEARFITGDEALFTKFQKALVKKCVEGHENDYIARRLEDQASRRAKFGNSASMQEPNVKNGCGGLRDFQNLLWMAYFKYRTRSLQDLLTNGMISDAERKQLTAAYDCLLRVRTEMHYHTNRAMDVLSKALQPAVASNLGYRERSPSKRIEEFMRCFYTHSRNIFLITRTLEQRLALLPETPRRLSIRSLLPGGRKPPVEPVDGFRFVDGQIVPHNRDVFREHPRRLMRVFLHAQQRGLRLHPDLAQLIRQQLKLVDRQFQSDEHVRETFLTILNQRGNVAPILRAMHEVDLLGKYIPEFGKMTCLVQHEFYHQYTADEHTLMCIEQLDKVWQSQQPAYARYAELFRTIERPFVLYLALLLHDVGKPQGHGFHSSLSAELASRVAKRLGLDAPATQALLVLIQHHLLLASTSQRRDLDDPAVIRQVTKHIKTPDNLAMLTIHTFVDSMATSDKLWNGFKDSLLWSLHVKTTRTMAGGAELARQEEAQRQNLKDEVRRSLPADITKEELQAHFANLPPRYFLIYQARDVLEHLRLANQFMQLQLDAADNALRPMVSWQDDRDRQCTVLRICTWDRAGLFKKMAGALSAAGLNILGAQIFTRADGIVLDQFLVVDPRTGSFANPEQRKKCEELLTKALTGELADFYPLIIRHKTTRPLYHAYAGEQIPTQVRFDNDASDTRTLLEVQTEDRLGLLYVLSQALTELALDIAGAKISTEQGAAIDTFYVKEFDGTKVSTPARCKAIERKLREAIGKLPA